MSSSSGAARQAPYNPFVAYADDYFRRAKQEAPPAFHVVQNNDPPIGFEITVFTKDEGPLTKVIKLKDGKIVSDGSACKMWKGRARRVRLGDVQAFAGVIEQLKFNQAITLGALTRSCQDPVGGIVLLE
jgi:hypothetical protein